jgi:hypothetical protein
VDTRNDYEIEVGTFRGSVRPRTNHFAEFPAWVERSLLPGLLPDGAPPPEEEEEEGAPLRAPESAPDEPSPTGPPPSWPPREQPIRKIAYVLESWRSPGRSGLTGAVCAREESHFRFAPHWKWGPPASTSRAFRSTFFLSSASFAQVRPPAGRRARNDENVIPSPRFAPCR